MILRPLDEYPIRASIQYTSGTRIPHGAHIEMLTRSGFADWTDVVAGAMP